MKRSEKHLIDWDTVDAVLLDMDGTLLDRHFDDFFFEEALPQRYADQQGVSLEQARRHLLERYHSVEGTLDWADLQYWSRTLHLDVVALTKELDSMIGFLPDAEAFFAVAAGNKETCGHCDQRTPGQYYDKNRQDPPTEIRRSNNFRL